MANLTQVLYGNRLYGRVTYQENNDPQTFNASFSDSQSSSDLDVITAKRLLTDSQASSDALVKAVKLVLADTQASSDTKVVKLLKALIDAQGSTDSINIASGKALADLVASADALTKIVSKSFSEITTSSPNLYAKTLFGSHTYSSDFIDRAIYMRDGIAKQIGKILAETIALSDGAVTIHQTKGFAEFVVLQEWFGMKLSRPTIWSATSGTALSPSVQTLYAKTLFGQKQFAATPIVEWGKSATNTTVWGNSAVQTPSVQSLYAKILFGQSLFSDKPVIAWVKPTTTVTENWTNLDGQNNQEA